MTPKMKILLQALRDAADGSQVLQGNEVWQEVYLPNVIRTHADAGTLTALAEAGYYKAGSKDFGDIKLS